MLYDAVNYRWIKTEKFFPRNQFHVFFTVHHISATCHHFKVGQKKIKNNPEQKTHQTKWIDCTEFFFKKIYIPVLKVKFVFYGKILFHKFFFQYGSLTHCAFIKPWQQF